MTIGLSELEVGEVIHVSNIGILYLGVILFITGVNLHNYYNKETHKLKNNIYLLEYLSVIIALFASWYFSLSTFYDSFIIFIVTAVIATTLVLFNIRRGHSI